MNYDDTGNFTDEQRKLARQIKSRIKKLRDSGCTVLGKQWSLCAYLDSDMKHAADMHRNHHSGKEIPLLDCGSIDDSGADDTEYFETGYITE